MSNILIIDDDVVLCEMLLAGIERMGHFSSYALTLEEGIRAARKGSWDVIFLDVWLPDGNGLDALPAVRSIPCSPEVIIFTGEGDPDGAQTAIQRGAWDYVEKPGSLSAMMLPLMRALEYRSASRRKVFSLADRNGILGRSREIDKCLCLAADAAKSEKEVLILGETGTGKELFARAVHTNSRRAAGNFVVVDCAALPETLAEGTLFGHEKGAYTGADRSRVGLVKQADGGTLFLDEIGELPLSLQKAFLRVLQEKTFRSLGGQQELGSDFRLIAATNRDLDEMVSEGLFREDLLFRIKSWVIALPPLRDRTGDIMEIALDFCKRYAGRTGGGIKGFSPEFIESLTVYPWPGNVRELLTALETAIETARDEPTLYHNHMPSHIRIHVARAVLEKSHASSDGTNGGGSPAENIFPLKEFRAQELNRIEEEYLLKLMHVTCGDIHKACEVSEMSRSRLYRLLREHHLTPSW